MKKSIKEYIKCFINGFCMSVADSLPGISGGTVAFILGFYDKLIISIDDLFRSDKNHKIEALKYLIKIAIGWGIGLLVSVYFLASLFEKNVYSMSSLFIGLILFGIIVVIRNEFYSINSGYKNIVFSILGICLVIAITYLNAMSNSLFQIEKVNIITYFYVFIVAALAISAMILPGISGSTIMLIFGVYIPIINMIKSFLNADFSTVPVLITFGLGMLFGIMTFTKFLRKGLEKRRSAIIYGIIGMMIGSIYSVIICPTTLTAPKDILSFKTFNFPSFLLGAILIIGLELLRKKLTKE